MLSRYGKNITRNQKCWLLIFRLVKILWYAGLICCSNSTFQAGCITMLTPCLSWLDIVWACLICFDGMLLDAVLKWKCYGSQYTAAMKMLYVWWALLYVWYMLDMLAKIEYAPLKMLYVWCLCANVLPPKYCDITLFVSICCICFSFHMVREVSKRAVCL